MVSLSIRSFMAPVIATFSAAPAPLLNGAEDKTEHVDFSNSGAAKPTPLYQYSWFSAGFAAYRRAVLKSYLISNICNWFIIWGCAALLYGAYYKNNELGKLKVYVVDLDANSLGAQVVAAFQASLDQPNHFHLIFDDSFTSAEQVRDAIYDEKAWGAVVVNPGATENLQQALAAGNASYDPASAIELISEGARNVLTANSHVVPGMLAILEPAVAQAARNASAAFLSANTENPSALRTALQCSQCLSPGYAYTQNDIRPAYNAAAMGAVLSGAIALIVFTFTVAGNSNAIGVSLGEHLNISSTIVWRLVGCGTAYFFISLAITAVQAAFGLPITTPWGGRGFVILWMLNFLTVSAFGYALESIVTIFGMWICNWFLNFWVFWNSSGASYSAETMPGFYQYYYGFPLVHAIQGTSTIVYGTKSHLGLNFGVLAAWMVGWSTVMVIATVIRLRWNIRQGYHRLP